MIRNYDEGDADVRGMMDRRKGGKLSSVCTGWIINADAAEPEIRHLRERKMLRKVACTLLMEENASSGTRIVDRVTVSV